MFRLARLLTALLAFTLLAANSALAVTAVSVEKPASGLFDVFEHRVGIDAVASAGRVDEKLSLLYDFASDFPVAARGGTTTVRHYTNAAGREAITESGSLRPGTFVTRPGEIPARSGHLQVEKALEIQPGRGSNYIDVEVPNSLLRVPGNGSTTSGGVWQRQLADEVPIGSGVWRRPPGGQPGN